MRTLRMPSTKAAYDRLQLLSNPINMPMPFDMERIAPFTVRALRRNDGKTAIVLAYKGKDIGRVGDHEQGAFHLHLTIPESPRVDAVITHIFTTLREHLDVVGRLLAEEKRNQRNDPNYKSPAQLRAEEEAQAHQERQAGMNARLEEKKRAEAEVALEKMRAECGGLEWTGTDPAPMKICDLTLDDMKMIRSIKKYKDPVGVRVINETQGKWRLYTLEGAEWECSLEDGEMRLDAKKNAGRPFLPDPAKVAPLLRELLDRNAWAQNPDRISEAMRRLPAAEYSVAPLSFLGSLDYFNLNETHVLGEGISLRLKRSSIVLIVDDLEVADWQVRIQSTNIVSPSMRGDLDRDLLNVDEINARIGSLWLTHAIPAMGKELAAYTFAHGKPPCFSGGMSGCA